MTEENKEDAKVKAKTMQVRVVHAVDQYHTRGKIITVPNDDYHNGLLGTGYLAKAGA